MTTGGGGTTRIAVWDLPTRLFHWLLAGLIVFAWWSADGDHLAWHKMAGSSIAGLLVFRLWWGLFGGSTARFSDFLRGPKTVLAYLSGEDKTGRIGHNPLGALSVIALLLNTLVIVVAGLFAVDTDGLESGPLSNLVDFDGGRLASKIHGYGFKSLEILIGLHLVAILFYTFVKRQPLVPAMVHGKTPARPDTAPLKPGGLVSLLVGLVLGGATAAGLIWLSGKS
jgi:cytochrome b